MTYETLLDASFKGVPFYVTSEGLERFGRRIVKHEYPNSNQQFGEDVGGFPPDFTVSGFVSGDDAKEQFQALRNACNEAGQGLLVLPFFGQRKMLAGECSVTVEPLTNVEHISFELSFIDSRLQAGFGESKTEDPAEAAVVFVEISGEAFGEYEDVEDPLFGETELADLKAMLSSIRNFQTNLKRYIETTELGAFLQQVDLLADGAASIINTGRGLVDRFSSPDGLFNTLTNLFVGNGTGSLISALCRESRSFRKSLSINSAVIAKQKTNPNFDFTAPQPVNFWPDDTADRIARNNRRASLIDYYKTNLLAIAYQVLADTVFDTEQQADDSRAEVEGAYIEMMHGIDDTSRGKRLADAALTRSRYLSNQDVSIAFERVRLAGLAAAEARAVVLYKVETAIIPNYYGVSCLNAAYLTQAEQIDGEPELLRMSRVMYQINGRQAYGLKGTISVLRRL
jgi:hypothetical protein